MKKHTKEGLDALIYLQEQVGVNFTITFLKKTGQWQFSTPLHQAVHAIVIRCKSFDDLILGAEKSMATAFNKKYGGDYKSAFNKDQQISQLEWAVDVLTKENVRLAKLKDVEMSQEEIDLRKINEKTNAEKITDFLKANNQEKMDKLFGPPINPKTEEFLEIGNPNIPSYPTKRKKGWKQVSNQKKSTSNPVVKEEEKIEKEGKYVKLKRRIHKEMFKRFRGITINEPNAWGSSSSNDIVIKNIEDIDKWKELDPSDYKREYTNARQRLYYTKQQKSIGNKVKPSKKKDKVVTERKYGITEDMIKEEMKRDYDNPWKAYKNKNWKKSFKRAKMRLYNNLRNRIS
tara:strand:- start:13701 stop:14732 length:1032 start_codon:yes stop_codon:yes gene_type:complete